MLWLSGYGPKFVYVDQPLNNFIYKQVGGGFCPLHAKADPPPSMQTPSVQTSLQKQTPSLQWQTPSPPSKGRPPPKGRHPVNRMTASRTELFGGEYGGFRFRFVGGVCLCGCYSGEAHGHWSGHSGPGGSHPRLILYKEKIQKETIVKQVSMRCITSNHRQIGVNIIGLLNRFLTSSLKCWTTNFSIHASDCPVFIMNQLKSVYNIPFLDSY